METPELQYICNAKDAISIKFVTDSVENSAVIHPTFAHQIFGDNEQIYGYKGLNIDLFFINSTMEPYISVTYTERIQDTHPECAAADDVISRLRQYLPPTVYTDMVDFRRALECSRTWRPMGTAVTQYTRDEMQYTVYRSRPVECKRWLNNARILVLLFIDASSFIDDEDDKWIVYCTCRGTEVIAFSTVYPFLVFPDKIRYRVSQMLVLPHIQRGGHGVALLSCIYSEAQSNDNVYDVTIEEPSDAFVTLRDVTDVKLVLSKGFFKQYIGDTPTVLDSFPDWSSDLMELMRRATKLYGPQLRRVYEICKLYYVTLHPALQDSYRLEVKKRLYIASQEDLLQLETDEERKSALNSEWLQTINSYREVIQRVWSK